MNKYYIKCIIIFLFLLILIYCSLYKIKEKEPLTNINIDELLRKFSRQLHKLEKIEDTIDNINNDMQNSNIF